VPGRLPTPSGGRLTPISLNGDCLLIRSNPPRIMRGSDWSRWRSQCSKKKMRGGRRRTTQTRYFRYWMSSKLSWMVWQNQPVVTFAKMCAISTCSQRISMTKMKGKPRKLRRPSRHPKSNSYINCSSLDLPSFKIQMNRFTPRWAPRA